MQEEVDLVTTSGREHLDLSERLLLLDVEQAELGRAPGTGAELHARANLRGLIMNACHLQTLLRNQTSSTSSLSRVECMVMAWRRGGHQEYLRVRRLQAGYEG